jgi:ElaB/YqjD/DUF883 family membrane-anchored ribosome-binding protein
MASTSTARHSKSDDNAGLEGRAAEKLRDAVSYAQDNVKDAADTVRDTAVQAVERTADQAQNMQGEFDSAVRRNPTLAVLGALGVGMVLGLALTRRT